MDIWMQLPRGYWRGIPEAMADGIFFHPKFSFGMPEPRL
jgi:hypothetical protein